MADQHADVQVNRVHWVDEVKVLACMLVVLGHFLQSMTMSGILPANALYRWFNQMVYYFHVPLFFICSGYLYQRCSRVNDARSWLRNVAHKALALGVPYFVFSTITWALKAMNADAVNDPVGGLADALFVQPLSPYWYLYTLFFIFVVTPTFQNVRQAWIGLVVAMAVKVVSTIVGDTIGIYAISTVLGYEIYFVLGMCISRWDVRHEERSRGVRFYGIVSGVVFLAGSVVAFSREHTAVFIPFVLSLLACTAVIALMAQNESMIWQHRNVRVLSKYTLPIYLMHTLFAAPVRIVLMRVGILNAAVHVIVGLTISIAGPMIAAEIMHRLHYPEFLLYPSRFIKNR